MQNSFFLLYYPLRNESGMNDGIYPFCLTPHNIEIKVDLKTIFIEAEMKNVLLELYRHREKE